MKIIAGIAGALLLAAILVSGAFLALNNACSLGNPPMVGQQVQHGGGDEKPKGTEPSEQSSSPQGEKSKPTARFELRKTDTNKVEGRYYAEDTDREKETWSHKFFCDTKIGEFTLAVFTLFLVLFTGGLWWSTGKLWRSTSESVELARKEFLSTHRPRLRVYQVRQVDNTIEFSVVNCGASDGLVIGSAAFAENRSLAEWPNPHDYPLNNIVPAREFPIGASDRLSVTIRPGDEPDELFSALAQRLRLYGFIVYVDTLGTTRTTFFSREYDDARSRFIAVDDPDLENEY
jgi:hypothetical protein